MKKKIFCLIASAFLLGACAGKSEIPKKSPCACYYDIVKVS